MLGRCELLHVLVVTNDMVRDWTARYRHGTVVTDDFTGLAANYAHQSLRPLWDAWLYSTPVPALEVPS